VIKLIPERNNGQDVIVRRTSDSYRAFCRGGAS